MILRPWFWTVAALALISAPLIWPWLIESRPAYVAWLWIAGR